MRANEQGEEEIYEHHKRCIVTIEEERKNDKDDVRTRIS